MITSYDILSLATLTFLEIVLGIDNLVFILLISSRLPVAQQRIVRLFGLILAGIARITLLASVFWLSRLTTPLFTVGSLGISARDFIMLAGGLFLIVKATQEIHKEMEEHDDASCKKLNYRIIPSIIQITLLDMVFSLDSVLTAIGLTEEFWIMATAIGISIIIMISTSGTLLRILQRNPTVKMLAFSFLLMIGMMLIADGFHYHINRTYLYVAIGFSLFVEILNVYARRRKKLSPKKPPPETPSN